MWGSDGNCWSWVEDVFVLVSLDSIWSYVLIKTRGSVVELEFAISSELCKELSFWLAIFSGAVLPISTSLFDLFLSESFLSDLGCSSNVCCNRGIVSLCCFTSCELAISVELGSGFTLPFVDLTTSFPAFLLRLANSASCLARAVFVGDVEG